MDHPDFQPDIATPAGGFGPATTDADDPDALAAPGPAAQMALAAYLSRWHSTPCHQLGGSEAASLRMAELVGLADPEDSRRLDALTLEYTDPLGALWLRSTIAAGYDGIRPEQVGCFAGAQEAMHAVMHAALGPGDHAIIVTPSYQSLETIPLGLCRVSAVALDPAQGWRLDADAVAAAVRRETRMVVINAPHNPTGSLITAACLDRLVGLCRHHGLWLLSDEVYRLTEHDPGHRLPQAAELYERGISLNGVSKAHGLPGLRVGWAVCRDAALLGRAQAVKGFLSTCNAGPSEVLAHIALKASGPILRRNRGIRQANRAALLDFLGSRPDLFDVVPPAAGMVAYPRYRGPGGVEAFVGRMAEDARVVLLPASVFRSAVTETPADRFRIGFGRADFPAGLAALRAALAGPEWM